MASRIRVLSERVMTHGLESATARMMENVQARVLSAPGLISLETLKDTADHTKYIVLSEVSRCSVLLPCARRMRSHACSAMFPSHSSFSFFPPALARIASAARGALLFFAPCSDPLATDRLPAMTVAIAAALRGLVAERRFQGSLREARRCD